MVADRRSTGATVSPTEWSTATAQQLLSRYGVLTREVAGAEGIAGGFSAVYDVLKAMEDAGRIRRGYFVASVGAMQFALPAALELMRSFKNPGDTPETVVLAATDPANPYGTMLKWPTLSGESGTGRGPTRTVGSVVVLVERRACRLRRPRRAPVARLHSRRRTGPDDDGSGVGASACGDRTPARAEGFSLDYRN